MAALKNYSIIQGEDKIITIDLLRDSTTIDLTSDVNIWAVLKSGTTTIYTYSSKIISGNGKIIMPISTLINEFTLSIIRDESKTFASGNINVAVLLEEITGQDIEPKRTEFVLPGLITVINGITKDIII